jgi:uncharacterized phage infection (PIP) family protein YhgE
MDLKALIETIPGAITAFFGIVAAFVGGFALVSKAWRSVQDAKVQAVPPTQIAPTHPQATNPFGHAPPQTDPLLGVLVNAQNTQLMRANWQMDELRKELDEMRRNMEDIARDARRTADTLVTTTTQLNSANAKIDTLQRALEQWQAEAARLERERDASERRSLALVDELRACKQQANAANSIAGDGIITPMRPRPRE